jgi:hypothetical protein
MPVISPSERDLGGAHPLLDGVSPTIGWQLQPQAKGGLSFVILRRTGLGGLKVVESFPLTEDGWAHAWQSLATHNTYCLGGRGRLRSDLSVRRSAGMRRYPRVTASTRGCLPHRARNGHATF